MGFNFGSALAGAAQGFLMTGNPVGAVAGGVGGGFTGGGVGAATGGLSNTALATAQSLYLAANTGEQVQNMAFQFALQQQSDAFDRMTSEKAETARETNTLRNVAMEQRKADITITREFIKSIV
ncbi:MAG: hypothetical protein NVS2B17_13430 [Candidatus Velthaea sp.]